MRTVKDEVGFLIMIIVVMAGAILLLLADDTKNEPLRPAERHGRTAVVQADHVVPPRLVPCDPESPLRDDVLAGCLWGS